MLWLITYVPALLGVFCSLWHENLRLAINKFINVFVCTFSSLLHMILSINLKNTRQNISKASNVTSVVGSLKGAGHI